MGYFDFLITIVPLLLVSYLVYFRIKNRAKRGMYKPGTSEYELYRILYSVRFLVLACIIASLSILDIVFRYVVRPTNDVGILYLMFILQMSGSVVALFMIYKLYTQYKKDDKTKK